MPPPAPTSIPTRRQATYSARLGFLFTAAGLVWLGTAVAANSRLQPHALTLCGMAAACALVATLAILRRTPRLPLETLSLLQNARIHRIVVAINILEWVGIATAASILLLLHLPEYIPTAAGIISGLYLFPIARALRTPFSTAVATLLTGWNTGALALLPRARQTTTGAATTGLILLAGSAATLTWSLWTTRAAASTKAPFADAPSTHPR